MNLKKIKYEDKKRILSLYLTKIGNCNDCGECQYCCYKYIINNLRNKEFTTTTKTGVIRNMPSFENMESFGYTILQVPLTSLIMSYPMPELKRIISEIPPEKYSEYLSPSFSESSLNTDKKDNSELIKPLIGGSEVLKKDMSFIDPKLLTGEKGLSRMMNFTIKNSPPEKGQFEYNKTILDNYGRIFSQELIGKYSSKIKSILDNIYNPKTNMIGEGIILIYSNYIDGGLIPMALALEEMGFTRYGQNVKPLFKVTPTPVIDVRTMKPPQNKTGFMPARYSLITGDPKISPDNNYEIKGLTGEDNKDGNKVKVVLISKAGSEGIDFKFIRQVHILDPWYNMNRIEQIIGRGVRNFSHKDLPFEKRNVEIFLHGTILGDNKEEAADLYVYRIAEFKAVQIGKITRVLKETAVDCIINHNQTNFTQEIMSASLKEEITQELSNGEIIHDFKIGDAPFSPACDYMATCNYSCRPDKKIDSDNLNEDTYNESFIVMNSEKILQRIRMLMKEGFFYTKDNLFKAIRTPIEYPYIQIFSALTQLIDDNSEIISDKYGRNGRLINIGEYYLFQPIELNYPNSSIFDRSVPIDYKRNMINFEVKKDITKTTQKMIENQEEREEREEQDIQDGKRILNQLKIDYETALEFSKEQKTVKGKDDWYKYCGLATRKLEGDIPEIKEYLNSFLVEHIIETLLYDDKLAIMNYLYSLDTIEENTFEWLMKEYFEKRIIHSKNYDAFILYKFYDRKIMILNSNNKWVEAEPTDVMEIASTKEVKEQFKTNTSNYNKIIGFIGYEKKNKYLIFKTRDMTKKRDTGARCDEAGKNKIMEILNEIVGLPKYTNETTKAQKPTSNEPGRDAISVPELCVIQEFMLRYFNTIKKDGKTWFLTPEVALYTQKIMDDNKKK
jgi:hypothetical protein